MTDKLPSYIEFTPQTDDCAAYYCGNDGVSVLTTYISDDSTRNGDNYAHARDCGNWRGGGEDNARDVSKEDLDALKRMVYDMRRNPELLRMSPFYSANFGGVASSIKDESMTEASCGAAAESQAFPSSFHLGCETSLMLFTPHAATRTTIPMSYYLCPKCNFSPKRTLTVSMFPPLPFRPLHDLRASIDHFDVDCAVHFDQKYE